LFEALLLGHLAALGGGLCGNIIGPNTIVQYSNIFMRMSYIECDPYIQVLSYLTTTVEVPFSSFVASLLQAVMVHQGLAPLASCFVITDKEMARGVPINLVGPENPDQRRVFE
jgi:hypothetical protein